jgi:Na+-translocating ferredoxin:NAD+ oxidoreductase RnfG subunit
MPESVLSSRAAALALALAAVAAAAPAVAKVFYTRSEALKLAFPEADRVDSRTYVLRDDEVERVQQLSHSQLESRLVKIHTGYKKDQVLGYAFIDVHDVRTLPEALLVVLTPDGTVRTLRVLAFHEPLEYMPTPRWYDQFEDKSLEQPLRLGGDVHGLVGATLSARATTMGVRRALALYEVVLESRR